MAAREARRKQVPPGPVPALGKRRKMTLRIPVSTLAALSKEANRRGIARSALVLQLLSTLPSKRRSMTFRIPEQTLHALTMEARRRKIPPTAVVVDRLMIAEKNFASAK